MRRQSLRRLLSRSIPRARSYAVNEEQPIHPLYAYLYVADKYEGLILVNAATLLDGDPLNNYLKRALIRRSFHAVHLIPDGALNDANNITIAGNYAYITTAQGLAIVSINDPLNPRIVNRISLKHPRQWRFSFVMRLLLMRKD